MKQIQKLFMQIHECCLCESIYDYRKFPSSSHGRIDANYMLISEAPGKNSLQNEKYWTGQGGKLLRSVCIEAGINLENLFYMTDIVKCWPPENRKPQKTEIINCSKFLIKEIELIRPKLLLVFGETASKYLLGRKVKMKEIHGCVSNYQNYPLLTLYHPSNINLHMNVEHYKKQLKSIINILVSGDNNFFADHLNRKIFTC